VNGIQPIIMTLLQVETYDKHKSAPSPFQGQRLNQGNDGTRCRPAGFVSQHSNQRRRKRT